jgi:calcineurin-like phosphoesterase
MRSFDCGETGSIDTSIGYDSPSSVCVIIPSGLFVESFEQVRGTAALQAIYTTVSLRYHQISDLLER